MRCVLEQGTLSSPSLVLVQPTKTRPFITERLLMGRKESNQTNKQLRQRVDSLAQWSEHCFCTGGDLDSIPSHVTGIISAMPYFVTATMSLDGGSRPGLDTSFALNKAFRHHK